MSTLGKEKFDLFVSTHSGACTGSLHRRGQIWLLAPLSRPAGRERGGGERAGENTSPRILQLKGSLSINEEPYLIFEAYVIGLLRSRSRLAQGVYVNFPQQVDEPQQHLSGHDGLTQRRVAAHHRYVEALSNGFELVRLLLRVHDGRKQQGVEHRLMKGNTGGQLL